MTYTVLSVRQPWAYCIMYLDKDIKNRTRKTNIRGTIAIHASKWGYVLQNPQPFDEPIVAKGNLGFWKYPSSKSA